MNKQLQFITEGKVVAKDGREFTKVVGGFGENKPLITTKQIAELMEQDMRVVNQTISRNYESFEESIHIIDIKNSITASDPVCETLKSLGFSKQSISNSKNIYLLSEAGFLLYLKFADGDKAIEIYKDFIEDYFKTKAENIIIKKTLSEELDFLKDQKSFVFR